MLALFKLPRHPKETNCQLVTHYLYATAATIRYLQGGNINPLKMFEFPTGASDSEKFATPTLSDLIWTAHKHPDDFKEIFSPESNSWLRIDKNDICAAYNPDVQASFLLPNDVEHLRLLAPEACALSKLSFRTAGAKLLDHKQQPSVDDIRTRHENSAGYQFKILTADEAHREQFVGRARFELVQVVWPARQIASEHPLPEVAENSRLIMPDGTAAEYSPSLDRQLKALARKSFRTKRARPRVKPLPEAVTSDDAQPEAATVDGAQPEVATADDMLPEAAMDDDAPPEATTADDAPPEVATADGAPPEVATADPDLQRKHWRNPTLYPRPVKKKPKKRGKRQRDETAPRLNPDGDEIDPDDDDEAAVKKAQRKAFAAKYKSYNDIERLARTDIQTLRRFAPYFSLPSAANQLRLKRGIALHLGYCLPRRNKNKKAKGQFGYSAFCC